MLDLSKESLPLTVQELDALVAVCGGVAPARRLIREKMRLPGNEFGQAMWPLEIPEGVSSKNLATQLGFAYRSYAGKLLSETASSAESGSWCLCPFTPDMQWKVFGGDIKSFEQLVTHAASQGCRPATPLQLLTYIDRYRLYGGHLIPVRDPDSSDLTILVAHYFEEPRDRRLIRVLKEHVSSCGTNFGHTFLFAKRPE